MTSLSLKWTLNTLNCIAKYNGWLESILGTWSLESQTLLHMNSGDRTADGLSLLANIGLVEIFWYLSHNE